MAKILIVEDDLKTANAVCRGLENDAIVLDWMLPGRDGISILKALRTRGVRTPVETLHRCSTDARSIGA
jgi:DNA-binding response OmpR family regulator